MTISLKSRLLAIAGMAVLASLAHGSLIDATVLIDRTDSNRQLTVRYSGAAVALLELRINGVSVDSKSVSDKKTSGETDFKLDMGSLEDGENKVEVRVYDGAGKLVGTQTSVVLVDRERAGPVFLTKPNSGSTVHGAVELQVEFERKLRDAFVSFFVNDEFMALKNYPPYTYIWDTAKMSNGWHEVQAMVLDGSNQQYKTQKVRVFVNNARTGFTPRKEDPTATTPQPEVRTSEPELLALATTGNEIGAVPAGSPVGLKSSSGSTSSAEGQSTLRPTGTRNIDLPVPVAPKTSTNATPVALGPAHGPKTGGAPETIVATNVKPIEPSVRTTRAETTAPVAVSPVEPSVKTPTVGTPSGTRFVSAETVAQNVVQPVTPTVAPTVGPAVHAATTLAPVAITFGQRLPDVGTFTIFYNNSPVLFDVAPRVTDGIPFTPFRHLFEQAGGKVGWEHASKTVLADGFGRHIWMRVGNPFAKIDDRSIQLERAPFIERGRTIVPLSFVTSTLDVEVQYDPNTGHMLVTSAEKR